MAKINVRVRSLAAKIIALVGLVNGTLVALFIGFVARSHDPMQEFSSDFGQLLLVMFSWFVPFAAPFLVIAVIVEIACRFRQRRRASDNLRKPLPVNRQTDGSAVLKFGTLGGEDSNHALVLKRYLTARSIENSEVTLFAGFDEAFDALACGQLDFVLQVSVHPDHTECVARYVGRAFIIDTFIASSKPLGILTRRDVEKPKTIALQPATRHYADLGAWDKQIDEASISTVAAGLLSGKYDSGIAAIEVLEQYPDRFRLQLDIGPIQDAWLLFGREPVTTNEIFLWPESPVRRLLSY